MFKLIRRVLPVVVALTAVVATPAAVAQDPFPDFGKRFTQYAGNPLLTLESINPWNFPRPGEPYSAIPGTVHPDVLYFPEGKGGYKFWMVFTPYDGWNQGPNPPNNQCPPWTNNECPPAPWRTPVSYWERLTLVRSNDGINWTKAGIDIGVNPLFSPADPSIPCPQGYGEYHSDPDLVYAENKGPSGESWFLYFASSCEHDVIELALSHDGIHYTRWPHPVIPWENGHVVDGFPVAGPTVVYDVSVGTFFGWYFNPPITPGGISFATSTNGIDWTPASTPNCSPYGCWSNGVVRPGSASCEGGITHPDVIKKGSEFWMYYQAQPGDLYHDLMIRRATSTDGIHWTKDPTAILSKYQPQPPLQACATTNVMPTQWTFWKRTEPAPTPTNVTMFYRPSAVVVGDAMYLYFGGLDKTSSRRGRSLRSSSSRAGTCRRLQHRTTRTSMTSPMMNMLLSSTRCTRIKSALAAGRAHIALTAMRLAPSYQ